MIRCETCLGHDLDPYGTNVQWNRCDQCDDFDWCKYVPADEPTVEAELRRKLEKANKENEGLRQVIKFQRDALGHLGEQFVKLSELLKENDV